MKRAALIIGVSDPDSPLPGVIEDVDHYRNYLRSPTGGAWEDAEIHTYLDKNREYILGLLDGIQATNPDYFYFHFSGHGAHYEQINQTALMCAGSTKLKIQEARLRVKRQTIVVDVCRQLVARKMTFSAARMDSVEKSVGSSALARYRFDQAVESCEEGAVFIYSCGINQSSEEEVSGGLFTQGLFRGANEWAQNPDGKVLDIRRATDLAQKNLNYPQKSEIDGQRRNGWFPFAVASST